MNTLTALQQLSRTEMGMILILKIKIVIFDFKSV